MIKSFSEDPRAMTIVTKPQVLDQLEFAVSKLEIINKGLAEYLEKKRLFFPRFFYF